MVYFTYNVVALSWVRGADDALNRKLRETAKGLLDEPHLISYINIFRDSMWPGGQLKSSNTPRTAEERLRTREEANRKLSALMPGIHHSPHLPCVGCLSAKLYSIRSCGQYDRSF